MKRQLVLAGLALILFLGICVLENSVVNARPPQPLSKGRSSAYLLAGEFRVVFANLLWIKVDQYHHEYLLQNSDWTKNRELIGMLNLVTMLDPHFEEAYAVGTSIYSNGMDDDQRAIDYLREGIHNNPTSWELHKLAAIIYTRRMSQPDRGLFHARLALKYCQDNDYLPSMQRLKRTIERIAAEERAISPPRP